MKKFAFAVQVFGIMAMFPVYVVLEMNQGIRKLPEKNNQPVVIENVAKTITQRFYSRSRVYGE